MNNNIEIDKKENILKQMRYIRESFALAEFQQGPAAEYYNFQISRSYMIQLDKTIRDILEVVNNA